MVIVEVAHTFDLWLLVWIAKKQTVGDGRYDGPQTHFPALTLSALYIFIRTEPTHLARKIDGQDSQILERGSNKYINKRNAWRGVLNKE